MAQKILCLGSAVVVLLFEPFPHLEYVQDDLGYGSLAKRVARPHLCVFDHGSEFALLLPAQRFACCVNPAPGVFTERGKTGRDAFLVVFLDGLDRVIHRSARSVQSLLSTGFVCRIVLPGLIAV